MPFQSASRRYRPVRARRQCHSRNFGGSDGQKSCDLHCTFATDGTHLSLLSPDSAAQPILPVIRGFLHRLFKIVANELIISVSGLRGVVGDTLTPDVAFRYAAAFAATLPVG